MVGRRGEGGGKEDDKPRPSFVYREEDGVAEAGKINGLRWTENGEDEPKRHRGPNTLVVQSRGECLSIGRGAWGSKK